MSNEELVIREGGPDDHEFIYSLGAETLSVNLSPWRSAPMLDLDASYRKLLGFAFANEPLIFIAELLEQRVGFALIFKNLPDEITLLPQLFLGYMAVLPEARGRGIATELFRTAELWGKAHGFPHIALMVTEVNDPAMRLYEKLGFVTERRLMCKTL